MQIMNVPDPSIINPHDAVVKVTTTAICGSDLHLYDGYIPTMEKGDILGHEFMREVVEVGSAVKKLKKGERVVIPFTIACGHCFFCKRDLWSACDNSNPNAATAETLYGFSGSGLFGYSHMMGGYAGGQAEYVRVPFADVGPLPIPEELSGKIDPSFVITHRIALKDAASGYSTFKKDKDDCIKIVMKPELNRDQVAVHSVSL